MSAAKRIKVTIDGIEVSVPEGTSIWDAARQAGIDIPVLCHSPRLRPVGVCRMCVVDIGQRVMAASCVRLCEDGMKVDASSPKVQKHRKMLTQLLLSDYPEKSQRELKTGDDQLLALARRFGIERIPFADGAATGGRGSDSSSPVIDVDHQACILCDKCLRGCNELQHNDVITRTGKGYTARIAFDLNAPMGDSTCVSCGECMAVCPTGALTNKPVAPVGAGRRGANR
ncbi:MAG TPA: 2Fe-2S iron-sulfur cluster-binding protein [Burkholderiales bacterium]